MDPSLQVGSSPFMFERLLIPFLSTSKLSLSMSNSEAGGAQDNPPRSFMPKRFGGEGSSHGKTNPFNGLTPVTTPGLASPGAGASSAFGLGSGAFASFGSAKTPKSPGNGLDFATAAAAATSASTGEKADTEGLADSSQVRQRTSSSSLANSSSPQQSEHPLKYSWVVWYRPPTSKYSDYEKSTIPLASLSTVESFWTVYAHLKRPSALPSVSDYHFFRKGIRPVWEDSTLR